MEVYHARTSGRYPWEDSKKVYPHELYKRAAKGDFSFMDNHNKASLFVGSLVMNGWYDEQELVDILKQEKEGLEDINKWMKEQ